MGNSSDNHLRKDKNICIKPGEAVKLSGYETDYTAGFINKEDAAQKLAADIETLKDLQDKLYASRRYALLIVFQAMDAAGKDSTIKHVMSGINPQGCDVISFKQPGFDDLSHDFLWRIHKECPAKGKIGIFNRSHYEEVLVTKVHPEYILGENIRGIDSVDKIDKDFWDRRYKRINSFEKILYDSGTMVVKFFLHLSKKEQKKRFLKRIDQPQKNWKFSAADLKERALWDDYQKAYEDAISNTSTEYAPWYIIPADNKWFMRAAVGDILAGTLEDMNLKYPKISDDGRIALQKAKDELMAEKNDD